MNFLKLPLKLIHPAIKKDALLYLRARTLLILLLFFLLVLVGYTVFFMINEVFFNTKALLNYSGILIIILCLLMLKNSINLKNPMRVLSYSGVFLITGGVYLSGGFASNDILWYVVVSVASLLFIGIADGVITTIISILIMIGFYVIDIGNLIELPHDELTLSIHYRFANAMIIIIILFFFNVGACA